MLFLNKKDINYYLIIWIATISIGEFQFGYAMGELNIPNKFVNGQKWYTFLLYSNDEPAQKFNILMIVATSMVPIAAVFSSFLTGILSYYGRRNCIFIANAFIIVGRLIWLIPNIFGLIIGRLFIGFGVGIFSVIVPIFINEISPTQNKGSYGVASQLAITFGILISYFVG